MAGKQQVAKKKRVITPKDKRRPLVRIRGVPKAEMAAASANRKALVKLSKLEFEATQKAKNTEALRSLIPVAKEINIRLDKAAALGVKANDHRLAAALQLHEARQVCKANKISFTKWVKANINYSHDEVNKLLKIGAAPEPAKALADMRAGTAARNRQLRERQRVSRDTPAAEPTPDAFATLAAAPSPTPADWSIEKLSKVAESVGMRVVSETEIEELEQIRMRIEQVGTQSKDATTKLKKVALTVAEIKTAFLALKASEKLMFVKWAADVIGVTVTGDFQHHHPRAVAPNIGADAVLTIDTSPPGDDLVDIRPAFLKRK